MFLRMMGLLLMMPKMMKRKKEEIQNKHKTRKKKEVIIHSYPVMHFHTSALFIHHCVLLLLIFRKSLKNIVLDDEDLELIRENKSFNQETLVSFYLYSINSPSVCVFLNIRETGFCHLPCFFLSSSFIFSRLMENSRSLERLV